MSSRIKSSESDENKTTMIVNESLQTLYTKIAVVVMNKLNSKDCNYKYENIMGQGTVVRAMLDKYYKILCKIESEGAGEEILKVYCGLGEKLILTAIEAFPQNSHMHSLFIESIKRVLSRETLKKTLPENDDSSSDGETTYSSTDVSRRRSH